LGFPRAEYNGMGEDIVHAL